MFARKLRSCAQKKRVGGKRKEGRGSEGTNPKGAREEEGEEEEEGANRVVYELTKKKGKAAAPRLRPTVRSLLWKAAAAPLLLLFCTLKENNSPTNYP